MEIWIQLALFISVYFAVIGAAFYFFVIADPKESPWAEYLSITIPRKILEGCKQVIGEQGVRVFTFISDRLLIIAYCTVVSFSWGAIFFFVYPWIDRQSYVSHNHKWMGYVVFVACVTSWRYASKTSPGLVTARTLKRFDHYPFDNLLFMEGKTCSVRKIPKVARSKFDRHKYQLNVARFDHYCGWVHNTIGEENYRFFLLFLVVHVTMCGYGTYVLSYLFYGELVKLELLDATFVDRSTGIEHPATKFILAQYFFHHYFVESGVLLLMSVMALALAVFLGYHCYLTSFNLTTNEAFKRGHVTSWYKTELKRYNQSFKDKTSKVGTTQPLDRVIQAAENSDVLCIPPSIGKDDDANTPKDKENPSQASVLQHPGPMPSHLYDRGFVENWKEVIFPISQRVDRSVQWTDPSYSPLTESKSKSS